MEATELRIGNLVTIDNNENWEDLKHIPMAVVGLKQKEDNKYSINVEKAYEDDYWCEGFSQYGRFIEPIPLTEEWLLQFGFEKDENKPFHFIRLEEYNLQVMVNGFSGTLDKDPYWFCSIVGTNNQTTFNKMYVHQLQNLYFALTGEELTIK